MSATGTASRLSTSVKMPASRWLSRLAAHLCKSASATEQAHIQRRLHDHHPDAAFTDAGQSRDDATGVGSYQPALPFFMQSRF